MTEEWDLVPGRGKRLLSSSQHRNRFWGPPIIIPKGYKRLSPQVWNWQLASAAPGFRICRGYTRTVSYVLMTWYLMKQWDKCVHMLATNSTCVAPVVHSCLRSNRKLNVQFMWPPYGFTFWKWKLQQIFHIFRRCITTHNFKTLY